MKDRRWTQFIHVKNRLTFDKYSREQSNFLAIQINNGHLMMHSLNRWMLGMFRTRAAVHGNITKHIDSNVIHGWAGEILSLATLHLPFHLVVHTSNRYITHSHTHIRSLFPWLCTFITPSCKIDWQLICVTFCSQLQNVSEHWDTFSVLFLFLLFHYRFVGKSSTRSHPFVRLA